MSNYIKAPQNAADRPARTKFNIDNSGETKQAVVERIEVAALEIDESFGADCDPYNSTGQFLADAIKRTQEE